jgi:hypothetical protein
MGLIICAHTHYKVAEGFAELMDVMYKHLDEGGGSVVAPRHFKRMIGNIAPQFQGYDQHDSQVKTIWYCTFTSLLFFFFLKCAISFSNFFSHICILYYICLSLLIYIIHYNNK